jgi:hypothetical protein
VREDELAEPLFCNEILFQISLGRQKGREALGGRIVLRERA